MYVLPLMDLLTQVDSLTQVDTISQQNDLSKRINWDQCATIFRNAGYVNPSNHLDKTLIKLPMNVIMDEINDTHQSKYHKEDWLTHAFCVGSIMEHYSDRFNVAPDIAFETGFFHDIGKGKAKKVICGRKKTIINYNGHAQFGEKIGISIGLSESQLWAISNHMCSCAHGKNIEHNFELSSCYQALSFDESIDMNVCINLLACLILADSLGRIGDDMIDPATHIDNMSFWLSKMNKLISKGFSEMMNDRLKWISSKRQSLTTIVLLIGCSLNDPEVLPLKKYLDSRSVDYNDKYICRNDFYKKAYEELHSTETDLDLDDLKLALNDHRELVQKYWINSLNQNLVTADMLIIETSQFMFPKAWEGTIKSLDMDALTAYSTGFKIAYYGSNLVLPITDNHSMFFPQLNSESDSFKSDNIDVAYGRIEPVIRTLTNYTKKRLEVPNQCHVVHLLNCMDCKSVDECLDKLKKMFPDNVIETKIELSSAEMDLIRISYRDGFQVFDGPSRDYRGETLIFDKLKKRFLIGRVSLPVMVDFNECNKKDPLAAECIHRCTKFTMLPKYDGSLFVLALVKKDTPEYDLLFNMLDKVPCESYRIDKYGIWAIGSRSMMFARNNSTCNILTSIIESIQCSYGNMDVFFEEMHKNITDIGLLESRYLSIIFEAINEKPYECLTVDYGKSFCPLLSYVVYDGITKKIVFPKASKYPYAKSFEYDNWKDVGIHMVESYYKMLQGDMNEEVEGFVVWCWYRDQQIGIKLKHQEYYYAHKPSDKNMFDDPKYNNFKKRLLLFKSKPSIEDITKPYITGIFNLISDLRKLITTKRNWVEHWNTHSFEEPFVLMREKVSVHYSIGKRWSKGKAILINSFDHLNTLESFQKFVLSK